MEDVPAAAHTRAIILGHEFPLDHVCTLHYLLALFPGYLVTRITPLLALSVGGNKNVR